MTNCPHNIHIILNKMTHNDCSLYASLHHHKWQHKTKEMNTVLQLQVDLDLRARPAVTAL